MKINRLETHDRYQAFTGKDQNISECCQNLINKRPFGNYAFYIFCHPRTDEDGVNKRMIWQPRLTRPQPQSNSMLFKAYPGTDLVKIIWMIPDRALWEQFETGKITGNEMIMNSIRDFQHNRELLARKEPDDLQDWEIDSIYRQISIEAQRKKSNVRIERI